MKQQKNDIEKILLRMYIGFERKHMYKEAAIIKAMVEQGIDHLSTIENLTKYKDFYNNVEKILRKKAVLTIQDFDKIKLLEEQDYIDGEINEDRHSRKRDPN